MNLLSLYRNRKVFITGHTGFKGAWLVAMLNHLGATVKGYALKPERDDDLYNVIGGDSMCDSVIADIRAFGRLQSEIESFAPQLIIHMAAQALVLRSYATPMETYEVNLMGTVNLLESVRHLKHRCDVMIVTTDKVYENVETGELFSENDRLGGDDPYSSSKACCELAATAYRHSFFPPDKFDEHKKCIATARSGNVIGGGDWNEHRIIPDIMRALKKGEPVRVRKPEAVRPWQFVLEPLLGYLQLAVRMDQDPQALSNAFNFGPSTDDMLTVEELVKRVVDRWGSASIEFSAEPQPHEAGRLLLASEKAYSQLGWKSNLTADEAIALTVDWYKSEDPKKTTLEQVKGYLERV